MGNRLHVAKKYDVQYASIEHFNWQCEPFHYLLDALQVEYTNDQYEYNFEVAKEDWYAGMEKLRTLNELEPEEREEILEHIRALGLTAQECYSIFSEYYDASDPDNAYMYFSFF